MLLTLLTAQPAGLSAGLKRGTCHFRIKGRLAGQDLTGGLAHIGTVKVKANAASEHLDVLFTKAGVCTCGTGLGAVKARLDALHQCIGVHRHSAWVRLDHLSSVGHGCFPSLESMLRLA